MTSFTCRLNFKMSKDSCSQVFIAVHAGAGSHSTTNEDVYKSVCEKACQQAMSLLLSKGSALEAVTAAVVVLENAPCTNAGNGSTLTFDGNVECDACVMDGEDTVFGAVGALSGVKNPVTVAKLLVDEQKLGCLPGGRVRPSILVGSGAQNYCTSKDIPTGYSMTSESSLKTYHRYKRKCQRAERKRKSEAEEVMSSDQCGRKVSKTESCQIKYNVTTDHKSKGGLEVIEQDRILTTFESNKCTVTEVNSLTPDLVTSVDDRDQSSPDVQETLCVDWQDDVAGVQDTVGAVAVDCCGGMAAASSSGGIWLKYPGRIGPAAVYGAGCWAQNMSEVKAGVASVTSGCGEHIMQTFLAKICCDAVQDSDDVTNSLSDIFTKKFLESEYLSSKIVKHGGALVLKQTQEESLREVELSWIHSTVSMCLAYMSGSDKSPMAVLSRLEKSSSAGLAFTMGGHFTKL